MNVCSSQGSFPIASYSDWGRHSQEHSQAGELESLDPKQGTYGGFRPDYSYGGPARPRPYYFSDYGCGGTPRLRLRHCGDPRRTNQQGRPCGSLSPAQDAYLGQLQSADQKKGNSTAHLQKMGFRKMTPDELKAYGTTRMQGVRKPDGLGDIHRHAKDMATAIQELQTLGAQGTDLWTRDDGKRVRVTADGSVHPF